ncbi:CIC11C00000005803 [Sungouiella intermedia]|uniref:ATP-dependent (S)-NAD(P)H-hydrate dehydratase n=1 Tax=Sungouiella intermedia TaxID=45354 RepID=A0A1L0DIE0_9ASCO|nr:CIC11C00000005803 [[Candida] intermedia]
MLRGKSQKELLLLARTIIQPLKPSYYKGQAGKVAVFGGCEDYTGAPFFSCHSAALVGADLSHIVCEKLAAPIIKSYSPDLMVHPYLYDILNPEVERFAPREVWEKLQSKLLEDALQLKDLDLIIEKHILPKVMTLVDRIDMFIVGPGFGRDPLMLKTLIRVVEEIKVANKPVILDADSLYLLSVKPLIIQGYSKAVITPNVVEFGRICSALSIEDSDTIETAKLVSQKLGGVIVVRKGENEVIARNSSFLINNMAGSVRRVGGQGDTLTGAMATLLLWAQHYEAGFWGEPKQKLNEDELSILAVFAACSLVRLASFKAFEKYRRAMQTSNVHEFLGEAYTELFDSEANEGWK